MIVNHITGPIGDILTNGAGTVDSEIPKMTVKKHDLQKLDGMQNELFFELLSTSFLHFSNKACRPLLLVPIMGLFKKVRNKKVRTKVKKLSKIINNIE